MIEVIPNWHPLLVHFPIALITMSVVFHLAARQMGSQPYRTSHFSVLAHSTLWLGALTALPTAIFGWLASNTVDHSEAAHAAMMLHRSWALATLFALAILAGWDAWRHKVDALPTRTFAGAVILAWVLIASTAWHGAELVYRHGIGVMVLQDAHAEQDIAPHDEVAHDHGHAH
ncbi:MAG: hypothetical protein A2061_03945 [Gallionellales bacterium GWA2_59_43]|nr:MAG: hypothetical protein A2061_03945 [Gallionellales bacterium GWA2_59_43]